MSTDWINRGRFMNASKVVIAAVAAFMLQSCATTTHGDIAKRLGSTDKALTVANQLAIALHGNGLISDHDWPQVEAGFKQAFEDIAKAREAYNEDPETAVEPMDGVQALLAELNKRLLVMQNEKMDKPGQ